VERHFILKRFVTLIQLCFTVWH